MEALGHSAYRINYRNGFDLDKKEGTTKLAQYVQEHVPRHGWVSLPCTRLSSLTNLTQRDEVEQANFQKRQGRDLKRAEEVVDAMEPILESDGDLSWEWPTGATKGWKSRAIRKLERLAQKHGKHLFWAHFHGCAFGLTWQNHPVMKKWTVATTSRHVWLALQRKCPGHQQHVHCRGQVAQASSYYPDQMVRAITKAVTASWTEAEDKVGASLGKDVSTLLVECDDGIPLVHDPCPEYGDQMVEAVRQEEPQILALTRNRFPQQPPTGKLLEQIKAQMLRVHKAAGHPSMANLQRMLRARKAPSWAEDLAGSIECPSCKESKLPRPAPVASMHETPGLFEIVGMDVFEYEFQNAKYKFLLMRDRASALVMVEFLKKYGTPEETAWEPTSEDIIKSFSRWLMVNPAPKWIITDAARYFTSQRILDYAGQSGIGVLTAPAEAHQMMGSEEGAINIIKQTVSRLLKDDDTIDIDLAFHLAAHGHNQSIGPSGFSPFQWTRGASAPLDNIPLGTNPKKAFGGMLRLKERAKVAFEAESAKARLSKLNNTIPQPTVTYKPGQL